MRTMLLLFAVVTTTVFAAPQIPTPDDRIAATADAVRQDGNTIHLRGHVEIRRGASVVRADQADLPARVELKTAHATIALRGNVQMTIEDAIPLTVNRR